MAQVGRTEAGPNLRVGIVTLHYGFNEGAILQAYSLREALQGSLGIEAEIVDVSYPAKSRVYGEPNDDRKRALTIAAKDWLTISPVSFENGHTSDYFAYLESRYDLLVTGSDVVWELRYRANLRRFFRRGLFPRQSYPFYPTFPNAYWLPECDSLPKVAYGASIGSFDWNSAPRKDLRAMGRALHRFQAIGTRDERTLEFVKTVCSDFTGTVTLTPDPTFLVPSDTFSDFDKAATRRLEGAGIDLKKRKVGFICGPSRGVSALAEQLRQDGWQVVSLSAPNRICGLDLTISGVGPGEWTRMIANLDLVITERMHATIFSILTRTPFVVIDQYESEGDRRSKVTSLLDKFGLDAHRVRKSNATPETLAAAVKRAKEPDAFEWDKVADAEAGLRQTGLDYLSAQVAEVLKKK